MFSPLEAHTFFSGIYSERQTQNMAIAVALLLVAHMSFSGIYSEGQTQNMATAVATAAAAC